MNLQRWSVNVCSCSIRNVSEFSISYKEVVLNVRKGEVQCRYPSHFTTIFWESAKYVNLLICNKQSVLRGMVIYVLTAGRGTVCLELNSTEPFWHSSTVCQNFDWSLAQHSFRLVRVTYQHCELVNWSSGTAAIFHFRHMQMFPQLFADVVDRRRWKHHCITGFHNCSFTLYKD